MQRDGKVALVVVDHGSRAPASNAALDEVAARVATASAGRFVAVLPAHMEIAAPTISDAFDSAVAAGASFVVVALYFLSPGRHSERDVPALAAEAAARHPGLGFAVTACLGPDDALAGLLLARADAALAARSRGAAVP